MHHAEKYRLHLGKSAAITTSDYSDVTVRRCLAGGASPVPSLCVQRWIFKGIRKGYTGDFR